MSEPTQHRTRWTVEEEQFLVSEWDGHQATTEVIADLLGRTTAACSQRYYELTWGTAADAVKSKPLGSMRVTTTTTTTRTVEWTGEVCERCYMTRSVNGTCGCEA